MNKAIPVRFGSDSSTSSTRRFPTRKLISALRKQQGKEAMCESDVKSHAATRASTSSTNKCFSSSHPPHSKFFFDMLCAMDVDVMGQYVVPNLFPTNIQNIGMILYIDEHMSGQGAGVYSKHVMKDLILPWIKSYNYPFLSCSYGEPATFPFNASEMCTSLHRKLYRKSLREKKENMTNLPYCSVIQHTTVEMVECIMSKILEDFVLVGGMSMRLLISQCNECSLTFSGVLDHHCAGNKVRGSTKRNLSSCKTVSDIVLNIVMEKKLPIHSLELGDINMDTLGGMQVAEKVFSLMQSHMESHSMGVKRLIVDGIICRNKQSSDSLQSLIQMSTRGCKIIKIGMIVHKSHHSYDVCFCSGITSINPSLFTSMATMLHDKDMKKISYCSTVESMSFSGTVLPVHIQGMDSVVYDVYHMPSLKEIKLDAVVPSYDSTTNFVNRCNAYIKKNKSAKLHQLQEIHLSFTSGASGVEDVAMGGGGEGEEEEAGVSSSSDSYGFNVDDSPGDITMSLFSGGLIGVAFSRCLQIKGPKADMFAPDKCPEIKRIVIRCEGGPISSLKAVDFLRSLIECRKDCQGEGKKLHTICICAEYMPSHTVCSEGQLNIALRNISEDVVVTCRKTYEPGSSIYYMSSVD